MLQKSGDLGRIFEKPAVLKIIESLIAGA